MRRWFFVLFVLASAGAAVACGSQSAGPMGPSSMANLTGSWVGAASDSSGSMMGSGMSGAAAGAMSWQLTQNGSTFSGTMRLPGVGVAAMMVNGTMNGRTGTFTLTMPMGSMMSSACSSTASGTFDMDDLMQEMHGTYAGSNSCAGPFDRGQMSLARR